MKSFSIWLEMRIKDPHEMRKIMMDYLDLHFDPKKGMTITMDTLGAHAINRIAEKIKNWTILTDDQKEAALGLLYQPNATIGSLADAIAGEPRPMPQGQEENI